MAILWTGEAKDLDRLMDYMEEASQAVVIAQGEVDRWRGIAFEQKARRLAAEQQRDELLAALKRSPCHEVTRGTLCAECHVANAGCLRYAAIAKAEGR